MARCCGGTSSFSCSQLSGCSLGDLGDVSPDEPTLNQSLVWNGTEWAPGDGGAGIQPFYLPEAYGAVGDGTTDDTTALQDAIDAAHAAGGGTVLIWQRYGWTGVLNIRGGVCIYQLSVPQLEAPAQPELGLVALGATAQVMYGQGSAGGSTNDNPGEVRNLFVDGAGVGGTGLGLFVCDAANSSLYNLNVRRSAGHGINVGSSQNLCFYNLHSGEHHNGTALLFKSLAIGRQGPGGNKVYGGHIGDSYLPIHVASNDPTDFFPPHDNIIEGVLFETGRLVEDATIRCNGVFEAGETVLRSCVATSGTQVTENEEDCCYLIDNPVFTGFSTTVTFDSCYFGGGAGAVKATDAIRMMQSGAFCEARIYGRNNIANVDFVFNIDGTHLGAGSDGLASILGALIYATGGISLFRLTNGAGTGGAWTGFIDQRVTPMRFVMPTGLGNAIQVRRDGDTGNRLQIDRDGAMRFGPGTGAIDASIINGGTGLAISGETVVQVLAVATGSRPAAGGYTNRIILDTTLGILIWSDGVNWRKTSDGTVA